MDPALVQRPPIPIFPFLVLPDIALCFLIALYPGKFWRFSAIAVFAYFNAKALSYTTGDGLQDYAFGSTTITQLFTAIHLLCLTDPLRDFRHKHDVVSPSQLPLLKRLWWSFGVNHGPRGIGWNYQVRSKIEASPLVVSFNALQAPNLQPAPTETRWQFVRNSLLRALRFFILMDLAQSYYPTPYNRFAPSFGLSQTHQLVSANKSENETPRDELTEANYLYLIIRHWRQA